ncbi:hypothetical protein ADZ37_25225 [Pannonibacter phragmitetus]|nr:hypothetical protein ADZ37_25225 [Pannonibacter phragmitetus]
MHTPLRIVDLRGKQSLLGCATAILEPMIDSVFPPGDFTASFLVLETSVRAFCEIPKTQCAEVVLVAFLDDLILAVYVLGMRECGHVLSGEPLETPPSRLERRTRTGIEETVKTLLPEGISQRRGKVCARDIPERRAFATAVLHDVQELVGGQNLCFFSFGYVRPVGLSRQDD